MSISEHEEKYMADQLEKITAQNMLMEKDKVELTRHRDQMLIKKNEVDRQNKHYMEQV